MKKVEKDGTSLINLRMKSSNGIIGKKLETLSIEEQKKMKKNEEE